MLLIRLLCISLNLVFIDLAHAATKNIIQAEWSMNTSATRQPVEGMRGLLLDAMANGEAFGYLIGQHAESIKKAFKSDHPILIDVLVIKNLDDDCKRLRIRNGQRQVWEIGAAKPLDRISEYQLDFCANGSLKWDK